jgi:hypothetical protein
MRGMRHPLIAALLIAAAASPSVVAAQAAASQVTVRTFMLQRLSQQQAADLLAPYTSQAKGEGVFTAGTGVRGVTVRGTRETLTRVDSLLRANDRPARALRLRFQLIAAVDSAIARDPAIADVETALRGVFQFRGYRPIAEGVVFTVEGSPLFTVVLKGGEDDRYEITGSLRGLVTDAPEPAADLDVTLKRPGVEGAFAGSNVLSTRLNAPLGKTVVLGSGAGAGNTRTMILVVRPEAQ